MRTCSSVRNIVWNITPLLSPPIHSLDSSIKERHVNTKTLSLDLWYQEYVRNTTSAVQDGAYGI